MSVIPFGAVFETATTGTFAAWASGSAAVAVFERVGPMMAATLSRLMKRWNTAMPCSFVEASSSMTASSLTPFSAPLLLISSTAARMPAFWVAPYTAAGPVMLSAAPIFTVCCARAGETAPAATTAKTSDLVKLKRMALLRLGPWRRLCTTTCRRWQTGGERTTPRARAALGRNARNSGGKTRRGGAGAKRVSGW